jgi:hypothetical protein
MSEVCANSQFFEDIVAELVEGVCKAHDELVALHNLMSDHESSPFGAERSIYELASEINVKLERKVDPDRGTLAQELMDSSLPQIDQESVFLGQIKALRQRNNGSCGYYTIFNAIQVRVESHPLICLTLTLTKMMLARHLLDKQMAIDQLKHIQSSAYFWTYFQCDLILYRSARLLS